MNYICPQKVSTHFTRVLRFWLHKVSTHFTRVLEVLAPQSLHSLYSFLEVLAPPFSKGGKGGEKIDINL